MAEAARAPSAAGPLVREARARLRDAWRALPGKRPLFEAWRRIGAPPERLWRHLYFEGPFDLPLPGGAVLRLTHWGHLVENELFWAGYGNGWEATSLRLWAMLAPQARTIIDVGANTGIYALAAAALSPGARVIAFEPVHRIADRLRTNVAQNGLRVEVCEAAASDRTGRATLIEPAGDHHYSASLERAILDGAPDVSEHQVEATRLDDFARAQELSSIDLIKIDAEMHEAAVIAGLGARLGDRPAMLVEILTPETRLAIGKLVDPLGYGMLEVREGEGACPASETFRPGNCLLLPMAEAERLGLAGGIAHDAIPLPRGAA